MNLICSNLIEACILVNINEKIKEIAIKLKQKYSIKIPDALIAATAIYLQFPILTADKGFEKIEEVDLILIEIQYVK